MGRVELWSWTCWRTDRSLEQQVNRMGERDIDRLEEIDFLNNTIQNLKGKGKGKGSGKKRGKRKQTRGQAPKYTEAELEAMTVAHVVMAVSPARTPVAVRVMDTAAKAPAPVSKRGHGCRRCKRS